MKRYLAFFGHEYYPMGGMEDFIGDFDSVDEALQAIDARRHESSSTFIWNHVYDTVERKIVAAG